MGKISVDIEDGHPICPICGTVLSLEMVTRYSGIPIYYVLGRGFVPLGIGEAVEYDIEREVIYCTNNECDFNVGVCTDDLEVAKGDVK